MADPDPDCPIVLAKQSGQEKQLGIVQDPDVSRNSALLHFIGYVFNATVIDSQFLLRQFAVGSLQEIVNLLGDLEKLRRRGG